MSQGELRLRCRLTIEYQGKPALSEAGVDLLEQIHALGSLSRAAKVLHYSYRRAWTMATAMNQSFAEPLVKLTTGGKQGGGAQLTPLGLSLLKCYRDSQLQIEMLADQATPTWQAALKM